ncbi:hypothetical protein [Photobacterium sp. GB-72]|uniref:hypothetical protein n=1 Tax=Photobacterium sp. GB-72 TaxID=2022105 RepID=UPI000D16C6E9|nr:hypothetical protein [Photobacterium sp. GB-72]PSV30986.1 hypothetical protein C9J40_09835 [Photobacterium sp. GB-72]
MRYIVVSIMLLAMFGCKEDNEKSNIGPLSDVESFARPNEQDVVDSNDALPPENPPVINDNVSPQPEGSTVVDEDMKDNVFPQPEDSTVVDENIEGDETLPIPDQNEKKQDINLLVSVDGVNVPHSDLLVFDKENRFIIKDNTQYILHKISGCNGYLDNEHYIINDISSCNINAEFKKKKYHVTSKIEGDGELLPSDFHIEKDKKTNVTISPSKFNKLISIKGCNGELKGELYAIDSVNNDCEIEALFEKEPLTSIKYENVKYTETNLLVSPKKTPIVDAVITNIENNEPSNKFNFTDIYFNYIDGYWHIDNKTSLPLKMVSVKFDGNIVLIQLSQQLPPYSSGVLDFYSVSPADIKLESQTKMFNPQMIMGPYQDLCSEKEGDGTTCYSLPDEVERKIIEVYLANMHLLANTFNYTKEKDAFFERRCSLNNENCDNYSDDLLPISQRNLMRFGAEGHRLTLKVMRNEYKAEGVGGGSTPNLSLFETTTGGWASIYYKYTKPEYSKYRHFTNSAYTTWYHEIAHGFGYGHSSGMTYGFADYFSASLVSNDLTDIERTQLPLNPIPELLLETEFIDDNTINIEFLSNTGAELKNVKFDVLTSCQWNYSLEYYDSYENDSVVIHYDDAPKCPLFLRAISSDLKFIATKKISKFELTTSKQYKIKNKTFTILSDRLLDREANGWGIRSLCPLNNHLATKDEYSELWQYLYDADKLASLSKKLYLASDGPRDYVIWQLNLTMDEMVAKHYGMTKLLNYQGLACVTDEPLKANDEYQELNLDKEFNDPKYWHTTELNDVLFGKVKNKNFWHVSKIEKALFNKHYSLKLNN